MAPRAARELVLVLVLVLVLRSPVTPRAHRT